MDLLLVPLSHHLSVSERLHFAKCEVLRRIVGPEREKGIRETKKLRSEELCSLAK
jgi:hypothetical protein